MTTAGAVLTLTDVGRGPVADLLARYGIGLACLDGDGAIPGSYWGDTEAGLDGNVLYARADTPVHSILHEACHYVCMDGSRRAALDTDAGGDYDEENAVCYLQILLADYLPGVGADRLRRDMDAWGYTFRLGSATAWFERDADDARHWLRHHRLVETDDRPSWRVRR